jgi:alkylhydroperoxidase family enzyme
VAENQVDKAKLSPKDRALLDYVELLTRDPSKMTDGKVQRLRSFGWTDEEIFEAAFDTSLFAFFNRMADAYGLDYPEGGWRPPDSTAQK